MRLISEELTKRDLKIVTEGSGNAKKWFIEGIFATADEVNQNGRIYPKDILFNAIDKFNNEKVKSGRALCELDHPEGPQINLDRVCARITELNFNGNNVTGRALVLDTEPGKLIKALLEGGCKIGMSTRAMASSHMENNIEYIDNDLEIITVDVVQDPSAPKAFVNGVCEGVEYIKEGKEYKKVKSSINKFEAKDFLKSAQKFLNRY